MDFNALWMRYGETRQYKDRWLALYKDLYFYVIPDRDAFNVKWNYRDDGKPTTSQIWDTTAMLAAYQRANDLHALLLPKDRVWGKLVLDPHLFDQEDIDASQPIMDEVNDRILFYINHSNLARVISSSNLDLVGGTGAVWVESKSDDDPLYFRSIPSVALYVEYSTDDVLNTCWYQCKMTGREVLKEFPKYKGKQISKLQGEPDKEVMVVYGQIKMDEDRFYLYAVLEIDPYTPLWEADRAYPQIIIYRDRVRPGESEGRGIGIDMLPTIIDLNRIVQYDRKAQAFKAYPPMFYDDDKYFNPYSVRQWAGAMIARKPNGRNPIEALQMPNYNDTMQHILQLQDQIKIGFQIDPLGEINAPIRSATEVSIRENRAQRTSSTDISRLINECSKQIFYVSAKILADRRLLTKDRRIGSIDLRQVRFDFQSPLADIQKNDDLSHFVTNMQIKQQFFGQGAAMATVNLPEVNKFLTDALNLKSKLFANEEQVSKLVQLMAEMQQQAALPSPSTSASQVPLPRQSEVLF